MSSRQRVRLIVRRFRHPQMLQPPLRKSHLRSPPPLSMRHLCTLSPAALQPSLAAHTDLSHLPLFPTPRSAQLLPSALSQARLQPRALRAPMPSRPRPRLQLPLLSLPRPCTRRASTRSPRAHQPSATVQSDLSPPRSFLISPSVQLPPPRPVHSHQSQPVQLQASLLSRSQSRASQSRRRSQLRLQRAQ